MLLLCFLTARTLASVFELQNRGCFVVQSRFAPCKVIRIPESGIEIFTCGIKNPGI